MTFAIVRECLQSIRETYHVVINDGSDSMSNGQNGTLLEFTICDMVNGRRDVVH
jgi:hypothetical protein